LIEALRHKEVLRRLGKKADLQAFGNIAANLRAGAIARRRCSVVLYQTTKIPVLRGFLLFEAL